MFQYSLEVSRSTSIVSDPIYIDLSATAGSSAVFPCDVDMDQILRARDQQQQAGCDPPVTRLTGLHQQLDSYIHI